MVKKVKLHHCDDNDFYDSELFSTLKSIYIVYVVSSFWGFFLESSMFFVFV